MTENPDKRRANDATVGGSPEMGTVWKTILKESSSHWAGTLSRLLTIKGLTRSSFRT